MATVGQPYVDILAVPGGGVSTGVTAQRISPTRVVTTLSPAPSTSDAGVTWMALVPAPDVPGHWWIKYTVAGAGAGIYLQRIDVEPSGYIAVAPRSYATTADLALYLYGTSGTSQPLPDDAEGRLGRATHRLDRMLKSAVYPNVDGEPTEAKHIKAMADAVCEWVAWWEDTGDESGVYSGGGGFSATAGRISLSQTGRSGGQTVSVFGIGWVPAQVIVLLDNAGLWGHIPYTSN